MKHTRPAALILFAAASAFGQATLTGSALALRSTGTVAGGNVQLRENGYLGTYVNLAQPGAVTFTLNALGQAAGGAAPRMNLAVDDSLAGWNVGTSATNYSTTFNLPAGTHFVRTEFANDVPTSDRRLTVNTLQVTGATIANASTDANALAAADTYIANFRKGDATISLAGVAPGTPVQVRMKSSAFRFGVATAGSSSSGVNTYLGANPAAGSTGSKYQQRLLENFNSITPENIGKWSNNEPTKDAVTLTGVDRVLTFAQQNKLRVRMHNLIWGTQQPAYVSTLLTNAPTDSAARTSLSTEITQRIAYYVKDRAAKFDQLDVYNESVHTPQYFTAYGAAGVAGIYNETAAAVAQAGASTKLFTNEYNVLADGTDDYAQWYRTHVESIRNAGGNVGGIGFQYYAHNGIGSANGLHSAGRIYAAMQNLAVAGLPLELTEFGIKPDGTGTDAQNLASAATIEEQTLRLVFGTPAATGFTQWGFWAGDIWDQAPAAAFYDANWNLTAVGAAYQSAMANWRSGGDYSVDANGQVRLSAYYGDYEVVVGGIVYPLTLSKGVGGYSVAVPEPMTVGLGMMAASLARRPSRRRSLRRSATFFTDFN